MNKAKLILLTALVSICLVSGYLFLRGGRVVYDPTGVIGSIPKNVDMQLSGVNYTEVTEGRRDWTLEADTLHYYKGSKLMVFDKVNITFFTGEGEILVTGDVARYDKKTKNVKLVGRVRALDPKGYRMTARELWYDVSTRTVFAPGFFKINGPKLDLEGEGLSVKMDDMKMKVLRNSKVLIKSTKGLL